MAVKSRRPAVSPTRHDGSRPCQPNVNCSVRGPPLRSGREQSEETLMRVFAAAIAVSFISLPLSVQPSRAEEPSYPWCASYNTDNGNHGACGYYTYEQCMSYVS